MNKDKLGMMVENAYYMYKDLKELLEKKERGVEEFDEYGDELSEIFLKKFYVNGDSGHLLDVASRSNFTNRKDYIVEYDEYRFSKIGIQEDICSGRPTILGTEWEPIQIASLILVHGMTFAEVIEEFDIDMSAIIESIEFATHQVIQKFEGLENKKNSFGFKEVEHLGKYLVTDFEFFHENDEEKVKRLKSLIEKGSFGEGEL